MRKPSPAGISVDAVMLAVVVVMLSLVSAISISTVPEVSSARDMDEPVHRQGLRHRFHHLVAERLVVAEMSRLARDTKSERAIDIRRKNRWSAKFSYIQYSIHSEYILYHTTHTTRTDKKHRKCWSCVKLDTFHAKQHISVSPPALPPACGEKNERHSLNTLLLEPAQQMKAEIYATSRGDILCYFSNARVTSPLRAS